MSRKLKNEQQELKVLRADEPAPEAVEVNEPAPEAVEADQSDLLEKLHGISVSKKPEKNTLPIELLNEKEEKPKTVEVAGVGKMHNLLEVARQHASGYQPTWDASLKAYARHMGFPSLASMEDCRSFLVKWGAKLKD